MTGMEIDPRWLVVASTGSALVAGGVFGYSAYQRRARR